MVHVVLLSAVIEIDPTADDRAALTTNHLSALALHVFFIELDAGSKELSGAGLLSRSPAVTSLAHIEVKSPDITPLLADSFEASRDLMTVDDVNQAQRLQKVYLSQVSARLRRVLQELQAASPSPAACLVNVVQNERGSVLDVLMDECEADLAWQATVIRAVRRASPLPLPPQGLAMGSYLTLDMSTALAEVARAETPSR